MRDSLTSVGIAAAILLAFVLFMAALTAAPVVMGFLLLLTVLTVAVHAFRHTEIDDDEWPY